MGGLHVIGALALFLAAIVSDDAKMFISGGETLPDQVPNRAYYDDEDPSDKELRLTTNVAAAVASCYSGLCERGVVGTESGSGWWEQFGPDKLGMETFKTNELWLQESDYGGFWLSMPSNRLMNSRRVLSYGQIERLRDVLTDFANGYWNEIFDYGSDDWNGKYWGSSKLLGDGFPTWDWDDRSPAVIVPDWSRVWPQFTSCTNDGIWRTSAHSMHGSLDGAFTFFDFGPFDDLYDFREVCYTNATQDSCYRILEDRLGTNACQFASDTRRLSYYRLGAIETAIAAMDTTYYMGYYDPDVNNFLFERRSYFHQKGYENARTPAVTIDWTQGTAEITGDPGWRTYEKWSTSTNDLSSYDYPAFVCTGDTPTGHQLVSGSSAILITWDIIADLGIPAGESAYVTPTLSPGAITFTATDSSSAVIGTVTRQLPMTPWNVTMSAGVTRQINVGYTSTLATDKVERVVYPTPWAWSRGMVSNDVTALEYRVVCTNALPATDNSGWSFYWVGDEYHDERAETRSVHLGHYVSTNAYLQAWRAGRLRHRSAVSNMLTDYLGCSLTDRESLIPIPDAPCAAMRDAAAQKLIGQLGAQLSIYNMYVSMYRDGDECHIDFNTKDGALRYVYDFGPGDSESIGSLSFSAADEWNIDIRSYMKGRSPCYSWGQSIPACRIGWRFRSLRDE